MKLLRTLPALAFLAASIAPAAAADGVGVRTFTVPAPERGSSIEVTLWYPAASGGTPVRVGDNAVFLGTAAAQDAPIAEGRFGLVLLLHGGLRAAPNLDGWIGSDLAAQGFVVAVPHPPGPADLKAQDAPREIWLRPADAAAALTAVVQDPALSGRIDGDNVGALGFLLGGTSALALAGGRIDAQAYGRSCDDGGRGPDCAWFAKAGDAGKVGRSNRDPRIKAIVAIEPELIATLSANSLSSITIPVEIVSLGAPDTSFAAADAGRIEKLIPGARHHPMPDATPFDSFSECKPKGATILREEGDDETLCSDGARPRAQIHADLAAIIAATFKRELRRTE